MSDSYYVASSLGSVSPQNSTFLVPSSTKQVIDAILALIKDCSSRYKANDKDTNLALNSITFQIITGLDGYAIRVNVFPKDEKSSVVNLSCAPLTGFYTVSGDIQRVITEIQNGIVAELNGESPEEVRRIIKESKNSSGCSIISIILVIAILGIIWYLVSSIFI